MMEKLRFVKFLLSLVIPFFGIFISSIFSAFLTSSLPHIKYPISIIDVFGFTPSFVTICIALYFYLKAGTERRPFKIIKISSFVLLIALLTLIFLNDVFTDNGLNFLKPMIILLVLFTAYNSINALINFEKYSAPLALISSEGGFKEVFVVVFSLVGFPLLFMDTYLAFWFFGLGIVGGAGLRDGLNVMLLTLFLYVLVLYGTMKLTNKIVK